MSGETGCFGCVGWVVGSGEPGSPGGEGVDATGCVAFSSVPHWLHAWRWSGLGALHLEQVSILGMV